jgi:lipoyl(octanoyl) transferase
MSRRILLHYFPTPTPYPPTLELQEYIHQYQLSRRRLGYEAPNILLLLQHRPVYTAGRRQSVGELAEEMARLRQMGADWVRTARGGETTYHGPGQIVAYPLFDLAQFSVSDLSFTGS